jgi:glycosyltransferase involved in cell wall biosynthesis
VELERCLQAFDQFEKENFELLVVDNDPPDDQTERVTRKFPFARYIREDRKGLDIARNTGIRYSKHPVIAFTDDDVVVSADWIDRVSRAFNDPLTLAVTGIVLPLELKTKAQFIFEKDWSFNKGFIPRKFDHRYFLNELKEGVRPWEIGAGANMAFRREAFEFAGMFDERLDAGAAGCSGDSEMWYRIMAEGYTCRYIPEISAYHLHRSSMKTLKNQLYNYMRGHVCALLIQFDNYGHYGDKLRVQKKLPKYYYHRIKQQLFGKKTTDNSFVFSEISGMLSGRKYYNRNANRKRADIYTLPGTRIGRSASPLVSVIIPSYNHGRYLPTAINSVLRQTYQRVEIIVVDDGSEDDTPTVCHQFLDSIRYVRAERVGLGAARNIGVLHSTGGYLLFLDADDFLFDNAIEVNAGCLQSNSTAGYVSGGHTRLNENMEILPSAPAQPGSGDGYLPLLKGNYIAMEAAVMYRREIFVAFHFDTLLRSCEDYDLNLRIARYYPVVSHDIPIAGYMIRNNSMSSDPVKMLESALRVLQKQSRSLWTRDERMAWQEGLVNWKDYYVPLITEAGGQIPEIAMQVQPFLEGRTPSAPPHIAPIALAEERPDWSVMIPSFNCGNFLRQAIESVLSQDKGADLMQIEVVDDYSTDIDVRKLVEELGGGRISFFRQEMNVGSLRNFETCINRAKGKYIHILHGDDYTDPGFYDEIEMMFSKFPAAGAACTGFTHVTENNEFITESDILKGEPRILPDWLNIIGSKQRLQTPAVVVKREVFEKLGSFYGVHYGEDWEMWVRIASRYPVVLSPKQLAHYRIHGSNISSNYFKNGQNIRDIRTVLKTISTHLPANIRARINRRSRKYWSEYFAHATDLTYGRYKLPRQALRQAIEAFKLYPGRVSFYFLVKTSIKVIIKWQKKL